MSRAELHLASSLVQHHLEGCPDTCARNLKGCICCGMPPLARRGLLFAPASACGRCMLSRTAGQNTLAMQHLIVVQAELCLAVY